MMEDFFTGFKKTALEPGEIVTGLVIPPLKENEHCAYIKHAVRKAMDLAIVGVAVKLTMDGRCLRRRKDHDGRGCDQLHPCAER